MPASLCTGRKGLCGATQKSRCAVRNHRWTASAKAWAVLHIGDEFCRERWYDYIKLNELEAFPWKTQSTRDLKMNPKP